MALSFLRWVGFVDVVALLHVIVVDVDYRCVLFIVNPAVPCFCCIFSSFLFSQIYGMTENPNNNANYFNPAQSHGRRSTH